MNNKEQHQQHPPPPPRAKSWAPSSKFNKILSNLERSIKSQFNGNAQANSSQNGERHKFGHIHHQLSNSSLSTTSSTNQSPKSKFNVQSDQTTIATSDKRTIGSQQQLSQQQKQLKSEPTATRVKTTLNKYQQQIVSTMRQNQHHLLLNSATSNANSINKLSIPPPHANDEARNQSHRLLFGSVCTDSQQQSDSANTRSSQMFIGSSATLRPSKRHTTTRVGGTIRLDDASATGGGVVKTDSSAARTSSSPASSAKSLPTTITASSTKSSGSHAANNLEDEESGFSNYQSNRSLIANNPSTADQSINQQQQQSNESNGNKNNNMIIMQTQTQVSPLISGASMNYNNSNATLVPQNMVYSYHPIQHIPRHQSINTQQQQQVQQIVNAGSNQVPIMSTLDQVVANNNRYTNNHANLSQQMHHQQQSLGLIQSSQYNDLQNQNQPQFLGLFTGSMPIPQPQRQQQVMGTANIDASVSGGQEIYANAPPKPRRYQYYDATATFGQPRFPHHQLMLSPQMVPAKPATMITTTTTAMPANNSNNAFFQNHHQQQYNRQNCTQQMMPNQPPIYNISYLQVPNMYRQQPQQQHHQMIHNNNERPNLMVNNNHYIGLQQRPAPPLPPGQAGWLTKSKSSLDACDLARYKLNKNLSGDTQQIQHQPNLLHHTQQLHEQQQQHHQIYGSRYDNSNNQQQHSQLQVAESNLHRSKSVSHLAPEHEHYDLQQVVNQQHQTPYELLAGSQRTITGSKLLPSASNTNLNYVGLRNDQNQFVNFSSQSHNLHQYHDLAHQQQHHQHGNQHSNQMFTATLQRQQQRMSNCWPNQHNNQASPNGFNIQQKQNLLQQQQQQHQKAIANSAIKAANSSSSVSGIGKIVRQSQSDKFTNNGNLNDDGSKKPSLDDKIRFLMTGGGGGGNASRTGEPSSTFTTQNEIRATSGNSQSAIYNKQADSNNSIHTWNTLTRQQVPAIHTSATATDSINSNANLEIRPNDLQNAQVLNSGSSNLSPSISKGNSSSKSNNLEESSDGGLFYVTEYAETNAMGNKSQRQYHVQSEHQSNKVDRGQLNQSSNASSEGQRYKSINGANSQLIVDLTTPRVLAKTQTTLLPPGSQLDLRQNSSSNNNKDSCSINQVGLPQLYFNQQEQPIQSGVISNEVEINEPPSNITDATTNTGSGKSDSCERTAPYYYSDLKSEEQRQALLSIVQQKSLSPPPQLLSRGTDQSGTRLALKSATLHPGQARILSENLAQRQRQQQVAGSRYLLSASNSKADACFSNSTANIAVSSGDRLFANSSIQPTLQQMSGQNKKVNVVQSMLALNSCNQVDIVHATDHEERRLSTCNLQSASSSKSVSGGDGGYFDGELKSSKSKSLENLSQQSSRDILDEGIIVGSCGQQTVNKFGVPVYENICRTDKLMSAINNSTTCLSSSKSRASRRPQVDNSNYPILQSSQQHQLQTKCTSVSDESMDSILGSSLDESDSSLDIIDEIKLSPTDNHLSDICKLIEQLKLNHSKLSDEYKTTLVKISKTINSSNKQMVAVDDDKKEKLARRLHLLELKSKKCETRSKNQLALIQMMENVLKQSKLRYFPGSSTNRQNKQQNSSSQNNSTGLTEKSVAKNEDRVCSSSSCLPLNHQNAKILGSKESPPKSLISPAIPERAGVIRAFVTESELKPEVKQPTKAAPVGDANKQISLSTRHHRQGSSLQAQNKSCAMDLNDKLLDKSQQQQKQNVDANVVNNNNNNDNNIDNKSGRASIANGKSSGTHNSSNSKESDAEDEAESSCSGSSSSGSSVSLASQTLRRQQQQQQQPQKRAMSPMANCSRRQPSVDDTLMKDDEDFIEFLSADTSSHRSQFEASQFSASDFNTSTSNSESSSSGANNDSLHSPLISNPNDLMAAICANNKSRSIFNSCGQSDNLDSGYRKTNTHNNNNNYDTNLIDKTSGTSNTTSGYISSSSNDGGKFKNVLGNVIDVDFCPLNNQAPNSPVNNQAS